MLPNVHVHASVVQISDVAEEEAVVATGEESLMELGANKVRIQSSCFSNFRQFEVVIELEISQILTIRLLNTERTVSVGVLRVTIAQSQLSSGLYHMIPHVRLMFGFLFIAQQRMTLKSRPQPCIL